VHAVLGFGSAEKVYENAFVIEMSDMGLSVEQQQPIEVYYNGRRVGDYLADVVVEGKVIVEIQAVSQITKLHEAQLVNYLKATAIEVGLILNFGHELEVKRKIFDRQPPPRPGEPLVTKDA
jgi:GxxExxY protein